MDKYANKSETKFCARHTLGKNINVEKNGSTEKKINKLNVDVRVLSDLVFPFNAANSNFNELLCLCLVGDAGMFDAWQVVWQWQAIYAKSDDEDNVDKS